MIYKQSDFGKVDSFYSNRASPKDLKVCNANFVSELVLCRSLVFVNTIFNFSLITAIGPMCGTFHW